MKFIKVGLLVLFVCSCVSAATIRVPQDQATIQAGINAAVNGDTVLVADGTYHERVSFKSKNLVVSSRILTTGDTAHIANTIIDGDSTGLPSSDTLSVVRIVNVDGIPELMGFTIVNGPSDGILCAGAGAAVKNCILVNNGYYKTYGSITPSAIPSLRGCHLVNCGIKTRSGPVKLANCDIDGVIERAGLEPMVEADSCIIGGVNFDGSGYFHARSCLIEGDILGLVAGRYLVDCTVNGTIYTHDAALTADSCVLGNVRCGNESVGNIRRSVIRGSIAFSGIDFTPTLTLSHCTVLDSIYRASNKVGLTLDSCNLSLSAPLHFDQYWRWIRIHCSNVYAGGAPWFIGTPDTTAGSIFDTTGVFTQPPQFCNPGLGNYTLYDTSPCAPANNSCGVLIGARDVSCVNEHVWHVSTTGDDFTGNGTPAAPFATIQRGIDRAESGDTVLVADGTYHERISFYSKAIVVGSWILRDAETVHIPATILNGDSEGLPESDTLNVVRIINSGAAQSELHGITIVSGNGDGLLCYDSRLKVLNCVFADSGLTIESSSSNSYPEVQMRSTRLLVGGVSIPKTGIARIAQCDVQGTLSSTAPWTQYPEFRLDSSTVGSVAFVGDGVNWSNGSMTARKTLFRGDITGHSSITFRLYDCLVEGKTWPGHEGRLEADSCVFEGIGLNFETWINIRSSLVTRPITTSQSGGRPYVFLNKCTVVDSIVSYQGGMSIWLDSCNLRLPAPIDMFDMEGYNRSNIRAHCCNIFANGGPPFKDVDSALAWGSVFDTSNVFCSEPQFCNPGISDYSIFDTSPCAPANNSCGVLIGARDVGCVNEHIWHVSTTGDDSLGNGTPMAPFATIQKGIDRAENGDTVLVQDGTYHERVSFKSKNLVVSSWILTTGDTAHIANTIIDGDTTGLPPSDTLSVVRIISVEGQPVLRGFTVQNGPQVAILVFETSTEVVDCRLLGNGMRFANQQDILLWYPQLRSSKLEQCGIDLGSRQILSLSNCLIDSAILGSFRSHVDAESSALGTIFLPGYGLSARSCRLGGSVFARGLQLYVCSADSIISVGDGPIRADSCVLDKVSLGYGSGGSIRNCVIRDSIKIEDNLSLSLSHSTLLGPVSSPERHLSLTIDTSIVSLSSPLTISNNWELIRVRCSNLYAGGSEFFSGVPALNAFDTSGVLSQPPQFCSPGFEDYTLFDTSPCAPANNFCGVLIGAKGIDCLNEHVWHVSTTGDDTFGNGSFEAPFATIQRGIDRAEDGDTVLVQDGTYHERISFAAKSIVVGSWMLRDGDSLHVPNTVINGNPTGLPSSDTTAVIRFVGNGTNIPTLVGITVTAGGADVDGVLSVSSDPLLQRCRLENVDVSVHTAMYLSTPVIRECELINCGVTIESTFGVEVKIDHSMVQGGLTSVASNSSNYFYVDSSTVGKVDLRTRNWLVSRASIFEDSIKGYFNSHTHIRNCNANSGIYLGTEAVLSADSSRINGIECGNEFRCNVSYSVITGPIKVVAPYDIEPYITLRHSTVVDSIVRVSGRRIYFQADTCNIVLPTPLAFDENWERLYFRCCNIYANGDHWYAGIPDTGGAWFEFDTTNVISLPPQFCNPEAGDFTLFDTSPCTPANNACGVLIGATDVGCSSFVSGDADGSGSINISDAVYLINYIFGGGPAPNPLLAGDEDCSGMVNISDVVYLINYIFAGGPAPCEY